MENTRFYRALENHVPENVVHYCYDLWIQYPFHFKITRSRKSRYGDFRYSPGNKLSTITVNHDLNKYAFLITYIHEIAHLLTFRKYGSKVAPHGSEWKSNFRALLLPICNDLVFPPEILTPLRKYMTNPKASSCGDPELYKALRSFDNLHTNKDLIHLSELEDGVTFLFKKRTFMKEQKRRTRSLCQEVSTGKKYLIPDIALVEVVQQT